MLRTISSLALTNDGSQLWVGLKNGMVRCVLTDGSRRGRLLVHGLAGEKKGVALDDVFDVNILNKQTLGVSPRGSFVAFGVPNEFLAAGNVDLFADKPLQLPMRETASGGSDRPRFAKLLQQGKKLGLCTPDGTFVLADTTSAETLLVLPVEYGDNLRDVSASASGRELLLAYSGRESLRVRVGSGEPEVVPLPLPPHTVLAKHTSETGAVLVNHNGAVVQLEGDTLHAFRADEGEDEHSHDEDSSDEEDSSDDEDFNDDDSEELEATVDWQLKNPEGVAPLSLEGNFEACSSIMSTSNKVSTPSSTRSRLTWLTRHGLCC